jgi:hypothetical protein
VSESLKSLDQIFSEQQSRIRETLSRHRPPTLSPQPRRRAPRADDNIAEFHRRTMDRRVRLAANQAERQRQKRSAERAARSR